MSRYLFIVARDRLDFFSYLQKRFSDDSKVEVILDRRRRDRQEFSPRPVPDRRVRQEVDDALRLHAYAVVILSPQ
jgi:hypothetical protein